MLPANHIFNTPIDSLPVDAHSSNYLTTIGTSTHLHLDLGQTTDPQSDTFYGVPYNVVHGNSLTWTTVAYYSADGSLDWDPRDEADCAILSPHSLTTPCTAAAAPSPQIPFPASPIVEGGINSDPSMLPYGDHHALIVDADSCHLWETYHTYPGVSGSWDIFGSAFFDLNSNALRPSGWTSADAAGFPMLPLLLLASEASTGQINHALRFTIGTNKIRTSYIWPARHLTSNGTSSTNLPPMGQLFRLKSSYSIPSTFHTQSRAILRAMQVYGMYVADGGSDMYVTGDPSASWDDTAFDEVQQVTANSFEAVDITALFTRSGYDPNSAAVPPP
jgi:hypothetical protein